MEHWKTAGREKELCAICGNWRRLWYVVEGQHDTVNPQDAGFCSTCRDEIIADVVGGDDQE